MDPGKVGGGPMGGELGPEQVEDVGRAVADASVAAARAAATTAFGAAVFGVLLSWTSCTCAGFAPGMWRWIFLADGTTALLGAVLMLDGRSEIRATGPHYPARVLIGLREIVVGALIGLTPLPLHALYALVAPTIAPGGRFSITSGWGPGVFLGAPAAMAFLVAAFVLLAYGRALQALKPPGQSLDHPGSVGG